MCFFEYVLLMIEKIAKEKVLRSKRHTAVCELVQQWLRHGAASGYKSVVGHKTTLQARGAVQYIAPLEPADLSLHSL